eukprot:4322210-Amphidinium_carterae.3
MGQAAHNYGKEAFQRLYMLLAEVVRENPTIQGDSDVVGHGDLLPQPLPPVGLTTGVDHRAPILPSEWNPSILLCRRKLLMLCLHRHL